MENNGENMKIYSEFINPILQKQLRKKLMEIYVNEDCSTEQFSKILGINSDTLSAIFTGEIEITPSLLVKILDGYNYFAEEAILYKQKIC